MFTWLNKQGVRSDDGFEVQRIDRFTAEYRESNKVITFGVESGLSGGLPCIIVDPHAFERWDSIESHNPITPDYQKKIFENVRQAMLFQGLMLVVEVGA